METDVMDTVAVAQHANLAYGTINRPEVINTDAYEALSNSEKKHCMSRLKRLRITMCRKKALLGKWNGTPEDKGVAKVALSKEHLETPRHIRDPEPQYVAG